MTKAPQESSSSEGGTGVADRAGNIGRRRDDPLSTFLLVAAAFLGILYFVEQRDIDELEAASVRAHALGASLGIEGCVAGSASTGGRTLVLDCKLTVEQPVAAAAVASVDWSGFDRVLFSGTDGKLDCPLPRTQWPQDCAR